MTVDDPQYRAKAAICDYWTQVEEEVTVLSDIVTVWFCYILGGWKTLMFLNRYPDNYFEVTYNKEKGEMYLDHYRKVHNEAIPDGSEFKMQQLREKINRNRADVPPV
jgi:hypothetical protein